MTQQKHVTPRMIGDWTTHFDADGYWTGTPGAVFLALCRGGGSFRDGGMLVIGRARTIRGASRVARRYAETTRGADTRRSSAQQPSDGGRLIAHAVPA